MLCSNLAEYDIYLYKGDDKTLSFRYKSDGIPVDITGYVISFESLVISLNQDADLVDPTDGRYDFVFSKEVTALIDKSKFSYEVVFYPTGLSGDKITMYRGSVKVSQEVF